MVAGLGDVGEPEDIVIATAPAGARTLPNAIATPITAIPQLATAAAARGDTDRIIFVDAAESPIVHTPGRAPNQWPESGEFLALPVACPWCGWWRDGACECPPDVPPS
ncbi:hypothetical protein [Nocardia sp. NPDC004722]